MTGFGDLLIKRGKILLLITVVFAFCLFWGSQTVWAESEKTQSDSGESRVFDGAGLFSQQETEDFEEQIQALKNEMNMDVVLVTAESAGGKSAEEYAEDFYINGGYGTGKEYSGVLFLIDMDNRELYILPVGVMNRFLTDKRWNKILDEAYEGASNGDYKASVESFLTGVERYYKAGIPGGQYNYDKETGTISIYRSIRWYEAVFAVLIALSAAGISVNAVRAQYSMKKERGRASNSLLAYRADCQFMCTQQEDMLVNKAVTFVRIPRNPGGGGRGGGGFSSGGRSTTHSSSGRTMGGGGRKF